MKELPPDEAVRLRAMGLKRYGGPPSAVAKADEPGADLPEACLGCSGCAHPTETGIGPRVDMRLARLTEAPLHTPLSMKGSDRLRTLEDTVVDEVLKVLRTEPLG